MSTTPTAERRDGTGPSTSVAAPPATGVGAAGRAVAEDLSALVNAHLELTKAELAQSAKGMATQAGAFGAAGALAWLGVQGLLITAGFALALVVPAWAAAGIVSLVLLAAAAIAAMVGKRRNAGLRLDATRTTVKDDVSTIKSHLGKQP